MTKKNKDRFNEIISDLRGYRLREYTTDLNLAIDLLPARRLLARDGKRWVVTDWATGMVVSRDYTPCLAILAAVYPGIYKELS